MLTGKTLACLFLVLMLGCQATPHKAQIQKAVSRAISEVEKAEKAHNNSLKKAQQISATKHDPKKQCRKKSGRCPVCKCVLSVGCGSRLYIAGEFPLQKIRLVLDGEPPSKKNLRNPTP